jgi:hypothetical protein
LSLVQTGFRLGLILVDLKSSWWAPCRNVNGFQIRTRIPWILNREIDAAGNRRVTTCKWCKELFSMDNTVMIRSQPDTILIILEDITWSQIQMYFTHLESSWLLGLFSRLLNELMMSRADKT